MEIEDVVAADAARIHDIKELAKGKDLPMELLPYLIVQQFSVEDAGKAMDEWVSNQHVVLPGLVLGDKKG